MNGPTAYAEGCSWLLNFSKRTAPQCEGFFDTDQFRGRKRATCTLLSDYPSKQKTIPHLRGKTDNPQHLFGLPVKHTVFLSVGTGRGVLGWATPNKVLRHNTKTGLGAPYKWRAIK